MTPQEKLKEMGYCVTRVYGIKLPHHFTKYYGEYEVEIFIDLDDNDNLKDATGAVVRIEREIVSQEVIDLIQIAFNNLQRDLKELKSE